MIQINNFIENQRHPNITVTQQMNGMKVIEYTKDLSISPESAITSYFASKMNIRRRQLVCDLSKSPVTVQAGAMQWMAGNIAMTSGIKGVGDMMGKMFKGKATGESAVKPEYSGNGTLVLEPTYKHLILINVSEWNGGIVLEDGMFLACESRLEQKVVARTNLSSAVAGGEGLFNLCLSGDGVACVEANCPYHELICIDLDNDIVKIDGSYAVAWSAGLKFTVERSSKSLLGSAASGEGLVNAYRGTGRILMAPLD